MPIPEITDSQMKLMNTVCFDPGMSVFSQTSSKEGDAPEAKEAMDQGAKDADHLSALGFLKEVTADHQEKITEINQSTGRTWRVFEITATGRAMFQVQSLSKAPN